MFDETGANNQDHSATFVVTSSVLDPARYPQFADSRSVADWLRPGRRAVQPLQRHEYMSAGADSQAYKRFGKTLDLTGRDGAQARSSSSPATWRPNWDWVVVEARDVTTNPNSDAWTTLPEADTDGAGAADVSLTTQEHGRQLPGGPGTDADAPHPFLLHYWSPTCEPTGTTGDVERVHRLLRRLDGLGRRPVRLRGQEGRPADQRDHRLGHARPGRLGRDLRLTDGATTLEFNDFETDLGGWTVGPPPAGTDVPTNGWERRTEEFKEGGVVATDDTLYTGFGFEGINESARNEFMKRTLTHLGVLPRRRPGQRRRWTWAARSSRRRRRGGPAPTPQPAPTARAGPAPARPRRKRASAKIKSSQDAAGRAARARSACGSNCSGDAGAVCRGTVELVRGKTKLRRRRSSPSGPARPRR